MKKNNKKGFTIVELVIVIAVIGILAAVLIPTFSNVIADAQEKAALQEAQSLYKQIYAEDLEDGKHDGQKDGATLAGTTSYTKVTTYTVDTTNGTINYEYDNNTYTVTYTGTTWTPQKKTN